MIILDTNVVSAVMRREGHPHVKEWFRVQDQAEMYLSAVTIAEIEYGLNLMPDGRKRRELSRAFEFFLALGFEERIQPFDGSAARIYGAVAARLKQTGLNPGPIDIMIAAIALAHDATVATRNTRDLRPCGVKLVNPFDPEDT